MNEIMTIDVFTIIGDYRGAGVSVRHEKFRMCGGKITGKSMVTDNQYYMNGDTYCAPMMVEKLCVFPMCF